MDNMALIEMSSMHYINMPKIVSKAHFVALKFILYCIVRGKIQITGYFLLPKKW